MTRIKFVTNVLQVILYLTVFIYLVFWYHKANLQFFHILANLILVVIELDLFFLILILINGYKRNNLSTPFAFTVYFDRVDTFQPVSTSYRKTSYGGQTLCASPDQSERSEPQRGSVWRSFHVFQQVLARRVQDVPGLDLLWLLSLQADQLGVATVLFMQTIPILRNTTKLGSSLDIQCLISKGEQ